MSRAPLAVILQVVIATAVTALLAGIYFLALGYSLPRSFLELAVRDVLGFVDIGILAWLILLIIGAVRKRGIGWGLGGSVLAAIVGTVINLVWIVALTLLGKGFDLAALVLGVQAGAFFLVAVLITAPLVLTLLYRRA